MTVKKIREIMNDEEITSFINARYKTNHIKIHDDAIIAWDVDGCVCFAYFNEGYELVTENNP